MAGVSNQRFPLFAISIDKLINNWAALQLAIENGQGGRYGKDIAQWIKMATEDYFYQNADLEGDEVCEFLGTIMNNELDTIVDDNSLEELGHTLCHHFRLAKSSSNSQLMEIHERIEAASKAPKAIPQKLEKIPGQESSSEGEQSDEEMDTGEEKTESGTLRAGHNLVTPPDDEGWQTVIKPPKKH